MTIEITGTEKVGYSDIIRKAALGVLDFMKQKDGVYVEISIVTEEEIREVNRDTRNVDSVTDVLSFPTVEALKKSLCIKDFKADVNPESGEIMLGEILICEKRAEEQAEEYGHGIERELGFLTVHGMLHLFGFDHMVENDEIEMRRAQDAVLDNIGLGYKEIK